MLCSRTTGSFWELSFSPQSFFSFTSQHTVLLIFLCSFPLPLPKDFVAFKTVMLYISTAKDMLRNPCKMTSPWPCTSPFTYHNILRLTTNGSLFTELVGGQRISSNLDSPEVGLNDLMQATMCEVMWESPAGSSTAIQILLLLFEWVLCGGSGKTADNRWKGYYRILSFLWETASLSFGCILDSQALKHEHLISIIKFHRFLI